MSHPLPLEDVRILAVEQYAAGPFGSAHLAALGADVLKIENPSTGGDIGRYIPPYQSGEASLFFESFNGGKRSVVLDLNNTRGRSIFEQLVRVSDAVYSNLRGDVPDRLRIRYDHLRHLNPKIVCCSLSGYGMTGPRRDDPAYDYILQGLTGWMSITGQPDGPPTKSGLSLVDFSSGFAAALALLAGLHAADRDGEGMDCDVSLFDVAVSMLTYVATWSFTAGHEPTRTSRSAHPSLVPFQLFSTSDGWIVVGCAKEKFWLRLTDALNRPDLADDPRYSDFPSRRANAAPLLDELDREFQKRTSAEWLSILGDARVPSGPVNTVSQLFEDPHVEAREMIEEYEHPFFGTVRRPASPVKVGNGSRLTARAPGLGADTEDVLLDLIGCSDEELRRWAAEGAFG